MKSKATDRKYLQNIYRTSDLYLGYVNNSYKSKKGRLNFQVGKYLRELYQGRSLTDQ